MLLRRFSRPAVDQGTGSELPNLAITALLALGVTLRLWHYFARRSLWIDEARLALNIGARDHAGLLQTLDYDQAAPPLFLAVEKLATVSMGMSELALRLFPLAAGIAALFLTWLLARRLVSQGETVVVLAIASIAPVLVYYSNEAKPYIVDAMVAAGLVLLARQAMSKATRQSAAVLGVAGAVATWLSTPAVFVLCGVGLSWLVSRRGVTGLRRARALAVGAAWILSFAGAYAFVYRSNASSPYLREFWRYRLLDPVQAEWLPRIWFALREAVVGLLAGTASGRELSVFWAYLSHGLTCLALVLMVAGALRIRREAGAFEAGILVIPLVAVLVASFAGFYPIALRLTLFGAPLVLVLVVAGAGDLLNHLRPVSRLITTVVLLATLGFLPYFSILGAANPTGWEHARPLILVLIRKIRPGEAVYIDAGSLPAWVFYSTDWTAPDRARLAFTARIGTSGGPAFENAPPRERPEESQGESLVYPGPFGPELYGKSAGMQWRWGLGLAQQAPDSGWATNEVRRMIRRPERAWWVLFVHDFGSSTVLRQAIESEGMRPTLVERDGQVQLVHYVR